MIWELETRDERKRFHSTSRINPPQTKICVICVICGLFYLRSSAVGLGFDSVAAVKF